MKKAEKVIKNAINIAKEAEEFVNKGSHIVLLSDVVRRLQQQIETEGDLRVHSFSVSDEHSTSKYQAMLNGKKISIYGWSRLLDEIDKRNKK